MGTFTERLVEFLKGFMYALFATYAFYAFGWMSSELGLPANILTEPFAITVVVWILTYIAFHFIFFLVILVNHLLWVFVALALIGHGVLLFTQYTLTESRFMFAADGGLVAIMGATYVVISWITAGKSRRRFLRNMTEAD